MSIEFLERFERKRKTLDALLASLKEDGDDTRAARNLLQLRSRRAAMKKLFATVGIVLAATVASRGDANLVGRYFCNPIASGGVAYVNGAWVGTKFTLPEPNIVSIKPAGLIKYDIMITPAGQKNGFACTGDNKRPVVPSTSVFNCTSGLAQQWTINLHLLRFRYIYFEGYIDSEDDVNSGHPSVVVGTCTRIAE